MGLLQFLGSFFSGHNDNGPSRNESLDDAQTVDSFIHEEGEGYEFYEEGLNMGTVPHTPIHDGLDTDKHSNSLLRRILGL